MGGSFSGISGGDRPGEELNGTEFLKRLEETQKLRAGQTPAEQKNALDKLQKEFSLSEAKFKIVKDGFERGEDPAQVMKSVFGEKAEVTKTDRLKEPKTTNRTGVNLRGKVTPTANPRLEAIKTKQAELIQKMTFGFEVSLASPELDLAVRADIDWLRMMTRDQANLSTALASEMGAEAASKWEVGLDPGTLEIRTPVQKMETIFSSMEPLFKAAKKARLVADFGFGGYYGGGGHIHIGRNIFDENPLLLRNLLVEISNRPYIQAVFEELADDQAQSVRQRGQMGEFKNEIDAIDQKWRDTSGHLDMNELLTVLKPMFKKSLAGLSTATGSRYRDVNLANLYSKTGEDPPTVEIRMHRGQSSAEDCRDLSEFWTYVLASLSLEKGPVPLSTMSQAEAETLRLPSRATALMRKFVRDTGIPNPERFDRFAEQRFPQTVVKLGPAEHPDVEIRFADFMGENDTPVYEVLVRNPSIRQIQLGDGPPIELYAAPELGSGVRVGKYVHAGSGNIVVVGGVPGVTSVDLTEARRPVDEFKTALSVDQAYADRMAADIAYWNNRLGARDP